MQIPKEILNLFPTWQYQCPKCGSHLGYEPIEHCIKCGAKFTPEQARVPPRFLKNPKATSDFAHKVLAPKLSPKMRVLLFKYFTTIFSDGFESNDFSAWTGTSCHANNTLQVQSVEKKQGTYASKHILAASHAQDDSYCYKDIISQTTCFMRLYVKITEVAGKYDSRRFGIMQVVGATGAHSGGTYQYAGVYFLADRKLQLVCRTTVGNIYDTSATTLTLNQWYCIELKFVEHASAGEVRVYLDGIEVADLTNTGLNTAVWSGIDSVQCGSSNGYYNEAETHATFYTDCVVVADAYIGPLPAASQLIHVINPP